MASKPALKEEIHEILKNADLHVMSAKKVRLQLEKKLNCDLLKRKDEIDKIVMDFVNAQEEDESESDNENELRIIEGLNQNSDDEGVQESSRTRAAPKRVYKETGSSDDEVKRSRKSTSGGSRGKKRSHKKAVKSDDEEDKPKTKKAKGKGNGFTRACLLSPELANLMGSDALPRHEVVKKMWSMIKERNLYDPKNKQYAICDEDLLKVMGVKRFRTFGMLKYLKKHIRPTV